MDSTGAASSTHLDGQESVDAFVSYARADQVVVRQLADGLGQRGWRVWVDWEDIPPTAEWMAEIQDAIASSDNCIVVLSPAWLASKVCRAEFSEAVRSGKRILPVVCKAVAANALPSEVAALHWIDLRGDVEGGLDELHSALRTDLAHVREHTRLLRHAREWENRDEANALLLRGSELRKAEAWLASAPGRVPSSTRLQSRYLLESRRASTRRQRGAVAVTLAVAIVAAALGVTAAVQRNTAVRAQERAEAEASVATSRALASLATTNSGDAVLSMLQASQAWAAAPTQEAHGALLESLYRFPTLIRVLNPAGSDKYAWRPEVVSTAVSHDGSWVAASGTFGIQTWSSDSGEPGLAIKPPGGRDVLGLALSGDGSTLYAALGSAGLGAWNAQTGEEIPLAGLDDMAVDVALSPDDRWLAVAHGAGGVTVFDTDNDRPAFATALPDHSVGAVSFGSTTTLAVGHRTQVDVVRLGEPRPSTISVRLPRAGYGNVENVAISSDGKRVAALSSGRLSLTRVGGPATVLSHAVKSTIYSSLSFSPDGRTLAAAHSMGVDEIDILTGERLKPTATEPFQAPHYTAFSPSAVSYLPTGDVMVSAHLGGVAQWQSAATLPLQGTNPTAWGTPQVTASRDGGVFAVWSDSMTVWDATSLRQIANIPIQARPFRGLRLSPDGSRLAVGGRRITVWDTSSGQLVTTLEGGRLPSMSMSFNSRGDQLLVGGPKITLWGVHEGEPAEELGMFRSPHTQLSGAVTYLPDDQTAAAVTTDGRVVTWNVATSRSLIMSQPSEFAAMTDLVVDPTGHLLVAAGREGVAAWTVASGELVASARVGGDLTNIVAFAPDGSTVSLQGEVLDPATLQEIGPASDRRVSSVAYLTDGRVVLGHWSGGPQVATVDPEALAQRAEEIANRSMTTAETQASGLGDAGG